MMSPTGSTVTSAPSERSCQSELSSCFRHAENGKESVMGELESPYAGPLSRLRCTACGYGVSVRRPPQACPMCRQASWEYEAWKPFGSLAEDLSPSLESSPVLAAEHAAEAPRAAPRA